MAKEIQSPGVAESPSLPARDSVITNDKRLEIAVRAAGDISYLMAAVAKLLRNSGDSTVREMACRAMQLGNLIVAMGDKSESASGVADCLCALYGPDEGYALLRDLRIEVAA
jgi:hypothetical protein